MLVMFGSSQWGLMKYRNKEIQWRRRPSEPDYVDSRPPMPPGLVIRNGTVIDGTGAPAIDADVMIRAGKIADIAPVLDAPDVASLDATGCVVAPGFIDIHSHSDFTLLVDPRAVSSIAQGVTTEVVGNCGHGCAPIGENRDAFKGNIYGFREEFGLGWRTVAEYLDRLEQAETAVNVAVLVPNGNLRLAVAGLVDRPSTPDELRQMQRLLAQGIEEGAIGYSTGLEYAPEMACPEEEISELCRVAAEKGGIYATHTRNREGEARETIEEALRTAARAQVPLQISHLQVVARLADDARTAVEQAVELVDEARRDGLDVGFDMHTRLFGTTNLSAALPATAIEGTVAEISARLRGADSRSEFKQRRSLITALAGGDWSRIVLLNCPARPEWSRRSVADISAEIGVEPLDAVFDILLEHVEGIHEPMIVAFCYAAEDVRPAFEYRDCMVGSDATALAPDGPLAASMFHGAYTWAAWFFREFVRDSGTFAPEEAIRRLTSLPATRLGLKDRGVLRTGAYADLAIFDPETFAERGTTFEPNQTAVGMRHVLVNGVVAVEDGAVRNERGGRVLR